MFTRQELWALEAKALKESKADSNPCWVRAYQDFAHACNVLDAFIARSSVPGEVKPSLMSAEIEKAIDETWNDPRQTPAA